MRLRDGDKILSVDNKPAERFNRIVVAMIFNEAENLQVERDGQKLDIAIPQGTVRKIIKSRKNTFISPCVPTVVGDVVPKSAADKMGMRKGDSLIAINGQTVRF